MRVVDEGCDLDALGLRARSQQLDHLFDHAGKVEGPRLEIEAAGFDLGEIENFLDQREQRLAGGLHGLGIGGLFRRQRRIEQEIRHAENAVERRADFVADHGEEARLGAIGVFGLVARLAQHVLGMHPVGDVAADALDFGLAADAQHDIAPGDPARAGGAVDFLVVHARAVRPVSRSRPVR